MKKILTLLLALSGLAACDKVEKGPPPPSPITPKTTTHYIARKDSRTQSKGTMIDGTPWPDIHNTVIYEYDSQMRVTHINFTMTREAHQDEKQKLSIIYTPDMYTCRETDNEGVVRDINLHIDEQTKRISKIEHNGTNLFTEDATAFIFNGEGLLQSCTPGIHYAKQLALSWQEGNITQSVVSWVNMDKKRKDKREYTEIKNNIYPDLNPLFPELTWSAQPLFTKELGIRSTHLVKRIIYDPTDWLFKDESTSCTYELDKNGRPIRITSESITQKTETIITYIEN